MLFPSASLVDTSFIVYKSFLAKVAKDMSNHSGNPLSGPTYLLLNTITSYLKSFPAPIFVFDGYPEEKYETYPAYKAHRGSSLEFEGITTTNLWKYIDNLFASIPSVRTKIDTEEADSTIASLAHILRKHNWRVSILTRDTDLLSLIDIATVILLEKDPVRVTEQIFKDKYGDIRPDQVRLYKAFLGDSTDGIPRVPRIKSQILLDFVIEKNDDLRGALASISANRNNLGKWYEVIREFFPQAEINYKLAEVKRDLRPLIQISRGDREKFITIIKELDIRSFKENEFFDNMAQATGSLQTILNKTDLDVEVI